ncbi:Holliday junction resolvase-like protein [Saccharolobus islandicus]|uniref:Putative secreted endonuclease distantly related to archaeal Holliday junction resolvase n=1 Tax=Saccharolobus islandicus LAL14/1 TaxID=1241935 RepID=M9U9I2_SACIS|nr:Holliday junction resolvase-like protein [Sulfolobus islandicus]AGJ62767.1 putative secreted endonuclease distantly related to archaeal Holliday junction resolvase [Sulfolobus islandicus LAL14/1]
MLGGIFAGISFILLIILIVVITYYSRKVSQLNKKITEAQLNSQQQAQQIAQQMYQTWVNQHSQQLRQQLEQSIKQQYEAQLEMWKQQNEQMIRKDAITRSVNTLLGRIGEEFAPLLLADKYQVNPKDFRHLGSPVDYIAFKGLSDDNVDPEVIFIEVKSGKSTSLSERERKVRDAIRNGKVRYEVVSLNDLIGEVQKKINEEINKLD